VWAIALVCLYNVLPCSVDNPANNPFANFSYFRIAATCESKLHEKNSCEFFRSNVKVFGYNMDAELMRDTLDAIRWALPNSLAAASKYGAVRLVVADRLTKTASIPPPSYQASGPGSAGHQRRGGSGVGPGAAVGLVLAVVILVSCVVILTMYCRKGKNKYSKATAKRRMVIKKGIPTRREKEFMRYFDLRGAANDGSLTNTAPETNSSNNSDKASLERKRRLNYARHYHNSNSRTPRRLSVPQRYDGSSGLHPDAAMPSHGHYYRGEFSHPVVLEFGPSFDMDRDRYLMDLDEESSRPPTYLVGAANNAMPSHLYPPEYVVWDSDTNQWTYSTDELSYSQYQYEDDYVVRDIQII